MLLHSIRGELLATVVQQWDTSQLASSAMSSVTQKTTSPQTLCQRVQLSLTKGLWYFFFFRNTELCAPEQEEQFSVWLIFSCPLRLKGEFTHVDDAPMFRVKFYVPCKILWEVLHCILNMFLYSLDTQILSLLILCFYERFSGNSHCFTR